MADVEEDTGPEVNYQLLQEEADAIIEWGKGFYELIEEVRQAKDEFETKGLELARLAGSTTSHLQGVERELSECAKKLDQKYLAFGRVLLNIKG